MRIRDRNRIPELVREIDNLNGRKIKVGYFGEGDQQMLAAIHEYGCEIPVTRKMRNFLSYKFDIHLKKTTTHIVIPERSFVRAGWDANESAVMEKYSRMIRNVVASGGSAEDLIVALAIEIRGKLQIYGINLNSPENTSWTAEQKGSSNPLVNTGSMIQSMTYQIE